MFACQYQSPDVRIVSYMSGHSKWSTIKRQKGAADIKRGMTFTKIANTIAIAAKVGGSGDFNANPRLRMALEAARAANMPKENVQRAIDRGLGRLPGQTVEEVAFEGFGPGKVAFIVEAITDNRLRTLQEIRNIFERSGGVLGSLGSTSYMFDTKGRIKLRSRGDLMEDEILELIDLGAQDIEDFLEENLQKYLVYVERNELANMSNKITRAGFVVEEASASLKPSVSVEINSKELAEKVLDFARELEEQGDVQKVYSNFVI